MAINYPTSLDTTAQPSAGQVVDSARIAKLIQMVEALEAKVGITGSAVAGSIDKRVAVLEAAPAAGSNGNPPEVQSSFIWTADPALNTNNSGTMTAGKLYCFRVWSGKAQTITSLGITMGFGGAGSSTYLALYTSAGVLMSQTSAMSTTSNNTYYTSTLGVAQALTAGTAYYVAAWNTGGSAPSPIISGGAEGQPVASNMHLAAPNLRVCSANTGLTTTAPGTLGAQTATGGLFVIVGF